MKKLFLSLIASLLLIPASRADEGMWIPSLIGKNYDEMVRLGLTLSKEDLYNINQASLKDAVVQFGGGCTAEMISGSGLLITNHHCGYDAIASLSSVEKNYLDNGFWAKSMTQELPSPGLSVIFLQRIEDVTPRLLKAAGKLKGAKATAAMDAERLKIETEAAQGGKLVANVREFFNGNQYLLLTYKKFNDVRLVGTPPKSLGKFGGDTDNWIWPRHTADFSMFRVYANSANEPAGYSASNVPYRPKKYLPINIGGQKEGDYAMIFGYPGRTNRYEVASGVDVAIKEVNPSIVKLREARMATMKKHMDADKSVYLKLTSSYQRLSNYWKYFIGQTEQLKRLKVVEEKQKNEGAFNAWVKKDKTRKQYATLINDYNRAYASYRPVAKHATYMGEGFRGSALARLAAALEPLDKVLAAEKYNQDSVDKYMNVLKMGRPALMREFDRSTEQDLLALTARMFYEDVPKTQLPDIYSRVIFRKFGESESTWSNYAAYVFNNTFLLDDARFEQFVKSPTRKMIADDAAAEYAFSFVRNYNEFYAPKVIAFQTAKADLSKRYVAGLMEMNKGKLMYPDANSTMRITYGQVKSYEPQDAVKFNYFTTLDGLVAKYKEGDEEFDAPKELLELHRKKDYGNYADADGSLHTCFITNNDITGGNSGSPVMNGKGEWIGIAFDGNWEAMSGDIQFDKQYKRTICVDSRFVLFLIDKLGGATNLIEEMDIRQ